MRSLALALLGVTSFSFASNHTVTYEPATVELSGVLDLQTFPGPPNYESIGEGDDIERHFYLKLDNAVDVTSKGEHPAVSNLEEERGVAILQLAIDGENDVLWARFRKAGKGAHVRIRGTLFHRFTGHHHSRVLLSVKDIAPLISQSSR